MPYALKLTDIGGSLGVVLPQEVLTTLNVANGQSLYLLEATGGFYVTNLNPAVTVQMELANEIMHRRSVVLHELAQ